MRAVVDTGPLVAAAYRRDRAHRLAATLITELGRDALVPEPVAHRFKELFPDGRPGTPENPGE